MSKLNPDQVTFVLKVLGKDWLYIGERGFPGETFEQSFMRETNNSLGKVAIRLALDAQIEDVNGSLISKNQFSPSSIQDIVQNIGMRVPPQELGSTQSTLDFILKNGSQYLNFSSKNNKQRDRWIPIENVYSYESSFNVINPTLAGYDIYLDPFLRTHLPSDINKDDETNFHDFAILAAHWLNEK